MNKSILDTVIDKFNYQEYDVVINNTIHLISGNNNGLDLMSGDLRFGDGATFGFIPIVAIYSLKIIRNGVVWGTWDFSNYLLESEVEK